MSRHPSTEGLLRWFEFGHLPPHLAEISHTISHTAHAMVNQLPDNPELSAGLRHLLEAKDCFVRAAILAQDAPPTPSQHQGPRETR